ncbi:MAG: hypothetical protein C0437_15460 [Ralstonia sp.]|nr:hypothetical protein [Ralstonia sp.]
MTLAILIAALAPTRCILTQMDMMPGAACGRVSGAAPQFRAARPSHSDDSRKPSEPIRLDTARYSLSVSLCWARVEVLMA